MTMSTENRQAGGQKDQLQILLKRREDNLNFFKMHFPHIYRGFCNYQFKHPVLSVSQSGRLDLTTDGKNHYGDLGKDAREYAKMEVEEFEGVLGPGKVVSTVDAPLTGDYEFNRFWSNHMNSLLSKSPIQKENYVQGFTVPNFYPSLVFMGVGLGLHIEELLSRRKVVNLHIFEPDPDRFSAALFTADWPKILENYVKKEGMTASFCIGPKGNADGQWRMLWNHLIEQCPNFPVITLFYNHLGDREMDTLIEKVSENIHVHLASWGSYDDEVSQANQAIHNLSGNLNTLQLPATSSLIKAPICVVGSGPSLDENISYLKRCRSKIVLVSCGSALAVLHKNDLVPDVHMEAETDYVLTVGSVDAIKDPGYVKQLKLVAPVTLNPHFGGRFKSVHVFLKRDSSLYDRLKGEMILLDYAGPTCTNLGVAFALKYGFESIFLFGLDFGFANSKMHHSKDVIYYKDEIHEQLKNIYDYGNTFLFATEAAAGGEILTQTALYTAKRRLEDGLCDYKAKPERANVQVYNCSNGAKIENSEYLNAFDFEKSMMLRPDLDQDGIISNILQSGHQDKKERIGESNGQALQLIRRSVGELEALCLTLKNMLDVEIENCFQFVCCCNGMNAYLEQTLKKENESLYMMLRGSIWHSLYIGYTHILMLPEGSNEQVTFLRDWRVSLEQFLDRVPVHFRKVIEKGCDIEADPWLTTAMKDCPEGEPFSELQSVS